MPVIINTNTAASNASSNLSTSNAMLQKSLARLSSGSKIVTPADDAGGLAVSMRMEAAIRRSDAASSGVANAISFLQTQDGVLKTAGSVLNRIAELFTLSKDVTKSADDVANYSKEFDSLKVQLENFADAKFNGVPLFGEDTTLAVTTSEDGTQFQSITQFDFETAIEDVLAATSLTEATLTSDTIDTAITAIAGARAQNGGESSNLSFSASILSINRSNLEAANSRIVDVDVAEESTRLAKANILVQSGTAMLSQANVSSQVALRLLGM